MPYMFMVPERHVELFGSEEPVSVAYMMMAISGIWEDKVQDWGTMYLRCPEETRERVHREYVREYELKELKQVCNDEDWGIKAESYREGLVRSIKEEGIKEPLLIITDVKQEGRMIIEGHHRAKAAQILGMKTVPAFLIHRVSGSGTEFDMTSEDMEKMEEKKEQQELLDKIESYPRWYQLIEFEDGVSTPGYKDAGDLIWRLIQSHLPLLEGKRILDLGSNAGLHCVRSTLAGASEAIGVDAGSKWEQNVFHDQAVFVKQYFEKKHNRILPIEYIWKRVEDYLLNDDTGQFDVVLAFGILYHTDPEFHVPIVRKLSQITDFVLAKYRSIVDKKGRDHFNRIFKESGFSIKCFSIHGSGRPEVMVQYTKNKEEENVGL